MLLMTQQLQYFVQEYELRTDADMSMEYQRFNAWMRVEIFYIPLLMAVDMLFLFTRSLTEAKLIVKMESFKLTEEHDFLISSASTLRMLTNTLAPGFISLLNFALMQPGTPCRKLMCAVAVLQTLQGLAMFWLIFSSYKEAPDSITEPEQAVTYLKRNA